MSVFRNKDVFDPDYVPDQLLFRELQLRQLAYCIEPAKNGFSPLNALCLGPPSTGKTSSIRFVLEKAFEDINFLYSYVRCPRFKDAYKVFSKIFYDVFKQQPPSTGVSRAVLMEKIWGKLEKPLLVVLDDLNFLSKSCVNDVLYEILKAPDEFGVKVGVLAVVTDLKFPMSLDPFVGSVFHYTEIYYPSYGESEIREILRRRVETGFQESSIDFEAFERAVELTKNAGDVRYGIFLLKSAAIIAESEKRGKITLGDIERAHEGEAVPFIAKIVSALNSDERAVLRIAYSQDEISTGELYELVCREVKMSYRKFYDILEKLERLKLIEVAFGEKGRGRTRYVYRKFDSRTMEKALEF